MKTIKIFLDAGHSFSDPGACSQETSESMEARKIRNFVVKNLATNKNFVIYQVPDNLNLIDSIKFVNRNYSIFDRGGICLAIHLNAGGGSGAEIFHHVRDRSMKAVNFINNYCRITGYKNRGAKTEKESAAKRLGWIDDTRPRAYLLEACFVDNKEDLDFLHNHLDIVGKAIIESFSRLI
jgi:N-acetylmuramoyl-L-alanine amidase